MKRIFLQLTILLLIPLFISAQPVKRAQKLMAKYDYSHAISILKKAATKEKYKSVALPLLGECYRMQHDLLNTKATYAQAVKLADSKPINTYYYAQALQANGDYALAKEMYLKYASLDPSDPHGKIYAIHCDSVLNRWQNLKPGFEVKPVSNVNTAQSDFGPAFYGGDMVFASDYKKKVSDMNQYGWTGRGFLDIMKSTPVEAGNFWGGMNAPVMFDRKLNQIYHDGPAAFSPDGNLLYLTRSYNDKGKREDGFRTNLLKIFCSTKTSDGWSEPKPFFLNSVDYSIGHPAFSPDGQTLYFVSDMPGGKGLTDVWMCQKEGEGWSKPTNLGDKINTTEREMFVSIGEDGTLYFASDGHPGYGALDIFSSKQANGQWSTPVNLHAPINGSFDDFALAFAPGTKNGFFSSNRPGGMGIDDIYAFRKIELPPPPEPVKPAFIAGVVKDKTTLQPLPNATVFLLDEATAIVKILKTGADGTFKYLVSKPANFTAKAMMLNYIADCSPLALSEVKPGTTTQVPRELLLDKLVVNKTFKIDNIYYDFDKWNIRADAKPELDKLVKIMNENPINVELGSHTDCRGTFAYNDNLSQNRAESAVNYIISTGIDKNRITAKGYGERQLTNKCSDGVNCTPEEHQANRRTEFKVTGFSKPSATEQFDPNKYNNGDEIQLGTFPVDFFTQCK